MSPRSRGGACRGTASANPELVREKPGDTGPVMTHAVPAFAVGVVGVIAVTKLAIHIATNAYGPYEFHRDEFLYFAMGEHLRLFSMDFPPFIAMLAEVVRSAFGDTIAAIRLPVALASTALVVLAAQCARLLGGRRFAQGLAGFCVLASLLFLRSGNLFQPVVFDQLWWTFALMSLLMLGRTSDPRWWIAYGVAVGLGLLTKFSILFLALATLIALVVTRERRWLKTRWPWLGAAIALAIGSPSIIGQVNLGFPVVGQMADLTSNQLERVTYLEFIGDQALLHGGLIVAIIGAWWLALRKGAVNQRLLGLTCVLAFLALLLLQGKSYYIGPIFPVLFAAGAVRLERMESRVWGRVVRWGIVTVLAIYLVVLLPLGVPVLGPRAMEQYLVDMGMQRAATTNVGEEGRIPQDYADMLYWEEMTQAVADVYHGLPPEDRKKAVILASNYGEAGAIEFHGPRYGLPPPVTFVGSYWHFGPGELPGDVLILVGHELDDWEGYFESVEPAAVVGHPYAVEEQRAVAIIVARNPERTLQEMWPSFAGMH